MKNFFIKRAKFSYFLKIWTVLWKWYINFEPCANLFAFERSLKSLTKPKVASFVTFMLLGNSNHDSIRLFTGQKSGPVYQFSRGSQESTRFFFGSELPWFHFVGLWFVSVFQMGHSGTDSGANQLSLFAPQNWKDFGILLSSGRQPRVLSLNTIFIKQPKFSENMKI